jgi:diguanylate cyclase (GGDEF)-like protein
MLPKTYFCQLLDEVGVAICGFDAEHRTTFWNRTFLDFFPEHDGFVARGEPYAENLWRFYRTRRAESEQDELERLVAEGVARHAQQQQPFAFTHHGRRLQAASMPDDNGGRVRIWRQLVETAATPQPASPIPAFDSLEHIPDGACVVDEEQRLLVCNDAFRRLYDLPSALPLVGSTLDEIVARAWRDISMAAGMRALLRNRLSYDGAPFEVELPGGRWRRVITRRDVGGVGFCVHSDITVIKRQQQELVEAQSALEKANAELALIATQDPLTGLANRRSYEDRLAALAASGVGLILIDVDDFKAINDGFGHGAGDDVLRLMALAIDAAARGATALAARIGGEEFAVVGAPDLAALAGIAHEIRGRLASTDWATIHSSLARVTVSMGLSLSAGARDLRTLKDEADQALYNAKRKGKDRIEFGLEACLAKAG